MGSPYKRVIGSLGTTRHTIQLVLICCHDFKSNQIKFICKHKIRKKDEKQKVH